MRGGDEILSSIFAHAVNKECITKGEWQAMNRCRLYLNILSIADITTGDGKKIDINFWFGKKDAYRSRDIIWPHQGNPSKKDWVTWRRTLRICLCRDDRRHLTNTLGSWDENIAESALANWRWFWDDETKDLFEKYKGSWRKYRKL